MVGDVVAGRYELEELVGTGGMSSVYRAKDRLLERHVAIKILHETYLADGATVERFRREARAVAQLSHPNIVTVIDRGEDGRSQFIVFEYVDGENLKQVLERAGRLPVRRALELAIAVGEALSFAHRHGLVHRDVKPQNVLLNGDGEPKVTDFGIARSLDVQGVTQTGTVMGTSNYIAPEQASGQPVGAPTDVYSLGVVLFEELTGRLPFTGDSFVTVALRHVNEPPPNVLELRPEIPLRVANALDRALAKAPADRYVTMEQFVAELEACVAELGGSAAEDATAIVPPKAARAPRSPRERARRRRRLGPLVALLVGLAALVAVVAAVFVFTDETPRVLGVGGGDGGSGDTVTAIPLSAVASYDPEGDNLEEHPEVVGQATDGNAATSWTTETYRGEFTAQKNGVGLVLDAGESVELDEVRVTTDTPGYTAEIRSGASPTGPFRRVSPSKTVTGTTVFPIDADAERYYVVWITDLDVRAHVNEVTARG